MKSDKTIIIGAGIAGIAVAYFLAVKHGRKNVILLDKLPPMSLTTSCSGENYRNFWPQQCMTDLTTHSYELMRALISQHGNKIHLQETGYQFISKSGTAPLSVDPAIAKTESNVTVIQQTSPYLDPGVNHVTTVHQAGSFDVNALGSLLLAEARHHGAIFKQREVTGITHNKDDFQVQCPDELLTSKELVICAGPFSNTLLDHLGITLPIESIPQRKFVIPDPLAVIPRNMPFTICADEINLAWEPPELELLAENEEYLWMLEALPAGLHIKPEGQNRIKLGWAYNRSPEQPGWHCRVDEEFPSVVLRGASQYIPGLKNYVDVIPTPVTQFAGYYTRTRENWPIIGPLSIPGLFTVSALSGYGTMAACAAGELCADFMDDHPPPSYASHFHIGRYEDAALQSEMASIDNDGQL